MAQPEADEAGLHHQGQQFLNMREGGRGRRVEEHGRDGSSLVERIVREKWRGFRAEGAAGAAGGSFRPLC